MSHPIAAAFRPIAKFSPGRLIGIVGGLLLVFVILRSAWLSEDSYISFRAIAHLAEGHGPRWNLAERVQVFTNPLWVLVVTAFYWVTGEFLYTVTLLGAVVSLGAVGLAFSRLAVSPAALAGGFVLLLASRAWIDYSTSGLENPMTFLVLAGFLVAGLGGELNAKRFLWLVFFGSLCAMNRLDTVLLTGPLILAGAVAAWNDPARTSLWRLAAWTFLAAAPLWGWLLFSTIYYGFPLPNTYYAKLATGIPKAEYYTQGWAYYRNLFRTDPATGAVIAGGLLTAFWNRKLPTMAVGIGMVFYLTYIVSVGGDFMRGRFFSAPFFIAVCLLIRLPLGPGRWATVAVAGMGLCWLAPRPPLLYGLEDGIDWTEPGHIRNFQQTTARLVDPHGIADERAFVYQATGLLPQLVRRSRVPRHPFAGKGLLLAQSGDPVVVFGNTGFAGYYAGSDVHIIDDMGLCDALIARLPLAASERGEWRVGHYRRELPTGYVATVRSGANELADPRVAQLYASLEQVTRRPLFDAGRWREIWLWNTGGYQPLIDALQEKPPEVEPN